ncbi:hypothetical protein [Mesonia sp. K4-1]|uniref:hypothetical protein n=1 Tax=Mesonia sp. K4-1 TaxID=2602760 RepID=UPI0011C77CF9|nr:hypothetical protein [Mesonia sp. K4-1]TXK77152.1 hypothetical protein FT986_05025 [Mesonia sp. K4-1]
MFDKNREYHYIAEMTLSKIESIKNLSQPKDDIVDWFFLKINQYQFSFIYKIINPDKSYYEKPFSAKLSFNVENKFLKEELKKNMFYTILRGNEKIGEIQIIEKI